MTFDRALAGLATIAAAGIATADIASAQSRIEEPRRAVQSARPAPTAARPAPAAAHATLKAGDGTARYTVRSARALPDAVINTAGVVRGRALVERDGAIVLDTRSSAGESLVFSGKLDLGAARASSALITAAAAAAPGAGSIIFRGALDLAAVPHVGPHVVFIVGDSPESWVHQQAFSQVRPAARDVFPTDSVSKQVDYGFAGSVGPLPTYPHKLQKAGVALPD